MRSNERSRSRDHRVIILWSLVVWISQIASHLVSGEIQAACNSEIDFGTTLVMLNTDNDYALQYKADENSSLLYIRLRARTTGWLGFGLSESGHMVGSDIVTVSIVNGEPVVEDRFAQWNAHPFAGSVPQLDMCNQWQVICAQEEGGYTDVVIARPFETEDTEDRIVTRGRQPVIFAWGDDSDVASYHGIRRGSTLVAFFNDVPAEFEAPNVTDRTFDLVLNDYQLSKDRTHYVLQKFDLGEDARHIVAVEAIVRDEDLQFAHHMVIHDCGDQDLLFPLLLLPTNQPVNAGGLSPLGIGACQGMVAAWGKGADYVEFPPEAGYKLGKSAARFIVLEFHLDNPGGIENRTVRSGVRLYTTSQLRPNDVGVIVLGDSSVRFKPIPAGETRAHYESTCPKECTMTFDGDIHVFRTFPHMHSYGKELWTTLYDDVANTSKVISYKQFWNFHFQDTLMELNVTIKPNDWLSTHCVYDTSKATRPVQFGSGSNDEMCMNFVMYYPKANAGLNCGSKGPSETVCRDGVVLGVANPQPDGQTEFPPSIALGARPAECSNMTTTPA